MKSEGQSLDLLQLLEPKQVTQVLQVPDRLQVGASQALPQLKTLLRRVELGHAPAARAEAGHAGPAGPR